VGKRSFIVLSFLLGVLCAPAAGLGGFDAHFGQCPIYTSWLNRPTDP
jgi:hypothetical protein